jgi:hypothetical protein
VEGWKIGRLEGWKVGRVEEWKIGRLEGWKIGRLEGWKIGRLEDWKIGRLEDWKIGYWRIALPPPRKHAICAFCLLPNLGYRLIRRILVRNPVSRRLLHRLEALQKLSR